MPEREMLKPVQIALVLCDNVYHDRSGKRALIGLFSRIMAANFPATHPQMCVFVSLTEIRPNTRCKLDIVDAETDEPVIAMEGPLPVETSPLDVCEIDFQLRNVVFRHPGTYYIRFWGNDQILAQRPFSIQEIPRQEKTDD